MPKLSRKFTGPYRVETKLHRNKIRIECRTMGETRVNHVTHLKRFNFMDSLAIPRGIAGGPARAGVAVAYNRADDAQRLLSNRGV